MTRRNSQVGEFEGLFRGVGAKSKEPVYGKKSSELKRLHDKTHFVAGCQKWDDHPTRGQSRSHADFADPQVVYGTCDAPENNVSSVDLKQQEHVGRSHFTTEQRTCFDNPGQQPLDMPFRHVASVNLGTDQQALQTQTKAVHHRMEGEDAYRAAALRAAGQGTLIPTSQWPKPPRCHVLHGGPRPIDNHDLGAACGQQYGRITGNTSNIVWEANARNPILGHHMPLSAQVAPDMRTTSELIAERNSEIPPLRSMMAIRPGVQLG